MGFPNAGGARPPMAPGPAAPGPGPAGGDFRGQPGGSVGDIKSELAALHASLPPEFKSMLNPNDPLTALQYKRLKDLSDEEGEALLMLFGNADPMAIAAAKKVWPEIVLLLDLFDDGEANGSIGDGAGMDAAPGAPMGAPMGMDEDYEDEEDAAPRSRLSGIMG